MIPVKKKIVCIFMVDIFLLTISAMFPNMWRITAILLLWSNMVVYSLSDIENNCALLAFLISFFTFLIGRETLERFGLHTIESVFTEELNTHAEILLLISLAVIFLTYICSKLLVVRPSRELPKAEYDTIEYKSVRYASKWTFYGTYLFELYSIFDIILYVLRYGYAAFYTDYTTNVPYIIGKVGDMSSIAFWVYLSTMPDKKDAKVPIFLYIIYLCITLGTGKRFKFVAGLLTLLVYFIIRNKVNAKGDIWFGKRLMRICVLGAPLLMILLVMVSKIRFGTKVETTELLDSLTDFFYSQGVSINVIKRTELYADKLPKGKIYMLSSIIDFLQGNIVSRALGVTHYSGNTVEHALYGNSLEHTLSYVAMGSYYLKGRGLGGCYIAEAFHDFRYLGVVSINLIYGIVLNKLFKFENRGIWKNALTFIFLNSLLLAPRGSADGFFADMVDLSTWGTFIVIYVFSLMVSRKMKVD